MEKQDILVVATAIIAFSILALVVVPLLGGQPAVLHGGATPTPAGTTVPRTLAPRPTTRPTTLPTTQAPAPAETPWTGSVKDIGFIDQPGAQATPPPNLPIPQEPNRTPDLVTYAEVTGRWSGTTENVYVPTPYWVMEYTAEPLALPPNAYPIFTLQVIDVENPNREVITPIEQKVYETPPAEPWSVKIFEGKRTYYFRIDTEFIKSYTITIKVPQKYL